MILLLVFFCAFTIHAQELTGKQLLQQAIAFHDPNGQWNNFKGSFQVTMQTPNGSDRVSAISIDLQKELFSLRVSKDAETYSYNLSKDSCAMLLNGNSKILEEDKERLRLSCERANMYKDYYTYLYGLPMKLNDPGTLIHEKVTRKTFKGKAYLVLKATYDKNVGKDTWYFYFDPTTYALEVYQFYHDEAKNDGEYILLEGMETINGIKMPKTRKWFYNKDDKYLGTDILN